MLAPSVSGNDAFQSTAGFGVPGSAPSHGDPWLTSTAIPRACSSKCSSNPTHEAESARELSANSFGRIAVSVAWHAPSGTGVIASRPRRRFSTKKPIASPS